MILLGGKEMFLGLEESGDPLGPMTINGSNLVENNDLNGMGVCCHLCYCIDRPGERNIIYSHSHRG